MIKVASQIINEKDGWFNFRSGDYQAAPWKKLMLDLMLHPKMNCNWTKNLKLTNWSKSTTGFWNAREMKTNFSGISGVPELMRINNHLPVYTQFNCIISAGHSLGLLLLCEYFLSIKGKYTSCHLSNK